MASAPVSRSEAEAWAVEPVVAVVRWGFCQADSVPEAVLVSVSVVLSSMVFVVRRPVEVAVLFQVIYGWVLPLVQGVFQVGPDLAWTPLDKLRFHPSVPQLVVPNRPVSKGSRSDYSRIVRQRGHVPSPVCIL